MITLTGLQGQPINLDQNFILGFKESDMAGGCSAVRMPDGPVYVRETCKQIMGRIEIGQFTPVVNPIDMILHCPRCGRQHIDKDEAPTIPDEGGLNWHNPPHRSHLCHGCGFIWRPADVCTNGVAAITTKGKMDHDYHLMHAAALACDAGRWRKLPAFIEEFQIDYVKLVSKIDAELK